MKVLMKEELRRKIAHKLKANESLYTIAKCIKSWHTEEFKKLIYGYYVESRENITIRIEHRGEMYPEVIVLYCAIPARNFSRKQGKSPTGFFALIRCILQSLNAAEYLGCVPVVEIGDNCMYYDSEMDNVTKNVFEYYFEPVSYIKYTDINSCSRVIPFDAKKTSFFMRHATVGAFESYKIEEDEISRLGEIYKKYIHLNAETDRQIKQSIIECLGEKRTLGVHVRGADFNTGDVGHPYVIEPEEYLKKAKEAVSFGDYEQIFLATDDANALAAFRREFGNKLVYYADTLRSSDNVGVHVKPVQRSLHNYKLGLEVLRDVYTLASCDSLICGLSHVAFAARYVKYSKDEHYKILKVIDRGIKAD